MQKFSNRSLEHLASCHKDLQRLFLEVIKDTDCSIICGYRSEADQEHAFEIGESKLQWPKSKHNKLPSLAADVMPYPVDWDDAMGVEAFAKMVKDVALRLGIAVEWGGDFPHFKDLDHWQLPG